MIQYEDHRRRLVALCTPHPHDVVSGWDTRIRTDSHRHSTTDSARTTRTIVLAVSVAFSERAQTGRQSAARSRPRQTLCAHDAHVDDCIFRIVQATSVRCVRSAAAALLVSVAGVTVALHCTNNIGDAGGHAHMQTTLARNAARPSTRFQP